MSETLVARNIQAPIALTDPEVLTAEEAEEIVFVSGRTYPELADEVCGLIGIETMPINARTFANGELFVRYEDNVRHKQVVILQTNYGRASLDSGTWSINDSIQETVLLIDAAKRASASEVTVIAPYLAYSRQDRKAAGREPISVAAHVRQLAAVGMDRLVTLDLHAPQTQMVHDRFDNLTAMGRVSNTIQGYLHQAGAEYGDLVFVAPDAGSVKLAEKYKNKIGGSATYIPKSRDFTTGEAKHQDRIEGVGGRLCVLVDDMIDTAGTIVSAANLLEASGAREVVVAAIHGILSDPATERLGELDHVSRVIVTDTVPQDERKDQMGDKLIVVDIAPLIGKIISKLVKKESFSSIYEDGSYIAR